MVVNKYLVSVCVKFHEDPCINAHARVINVRTIFRECARLRLVCARLQLVCAHLCTDLHEIFFGGQVMSCELKFQIS